MKCKTVFLLLLFSVSFHSIKAQSWDTTYYIKYNHKLCLTLSAIGKSFNIPIEQKLFPDTSFSSASWTAEARTGIGIGVNWDILGFYIGLASFRGDDKDKGQTDYYNFALSIGGAKYFVETSYRKYEGFYDANSGSYDSTFLKTGVYYQDSDLRVEYGQARFFYVFNNKKFAVKAAYSSTYRQTKSAASLIGFANVYYKAITSPNGIVPDPLSQFYGDYQNWSALYVPGISAGLGVSGNLVIGHRFLLNGTLAFALESQWRRYSFRDRPSYNANHLSPIGDSRVAISYNAPRFLISLYSKTDFSYYNNHALNLEARFLSAEIDIGYRFNFKDPSFMPKVRKWWLYRLFD